MAHYGVGLDSEVSRIHLELKLALSRKGGISARNLEKVFKSMDRNQNAKLELNEFEFGLGKLGLFMKKVDLQALLKYYDKDGDNCINFTEFVNAIREPLNERRANVLFQVYKTLDPENVGRIPVSKIWDNFDVTKVKEYRYGIKKSEEIIRDFLSNFSFIEPGSTEGYITADEFYSYYSDVSPLYPSDDLFIDYMNNTWGHKEKSEKLPSKEEIKNIISTLRRKLLNKTQGAKEEFLLRKIFREFDTNQSGFLTTDELEAMFILLEMPVHKNYVLATLQFLDKDQKGYLDFEDFANYVIYDIYK